MVADVTTRESPSDANKSARKGTRPPRKTGKAGLKTAPESKSAGKPAAKGVKPAKRAPKVAARPTTRKAKATAPKRPTKPIARAAGRPAIIEPPRKSVTKAGFVRSHPTTIPARDVVVAAAKLGLHMTPDYVHKVRSSTKARDRFAGVALPAPRAKTLSSEPASRASAGPTTSGESAFRKLVLELGLDRAKRLLAEIERRLAPLLR